MMQVTKSRRTVKKKTEIVLAVYTCANANDDWREVGELVRSPFWGDNYPNRLEFKPNGKWITAKDLLGIVDYMNDYIA